MSLNRLLSTLELCCTGAGVGEATPKLHKQAIKLSKVGKKITPWCKADRVDIWGKSNSDMSDSVFHKTRSTPPAAASRDGEKCFCVSLDLQ